MQKQIVFRSISLSGTCTVVSLVPANGGADRLEAAPLAFSTLPLDAFQNSAAPPR
jgi:hypothetical protein